MKRGILAAAALALAATQTGCPGESGPGGCASSETKCGSACCASGQACNASQQCVAGYRVRIEAWEGKGAVSAAGVTCHWPNGCWVTIPVGETLTVTATPDAGSTLVGFTGADAVSGSTATITPTAGPERKVWAYFRVDGATPQCPTLTTHACTHGTFATFNNARFPATFSSGTVVDVRQAPCTFVAGRKTTGAQWSCADSYLCGAAPYSFEVSALDLGWGSGPGWSISSDTEAWYSDVLCDGVCTLSSQCGLDQQCTGGACVPRPGGGGACSGCLDACRGLPGCCTGTGCICEGC